MPHSAVVSEQVCLQQPFELSETVALLQFQRQRVLRAWSVVRGQGHSRSLMLVPIESLYVKCWMKNISEVRKTKYIAQLHKQAAHDL